jgi:hypothetical protein
MKKSNESHLSVFCADIGSVKRGNFGWAGILHAGHKEIPLSGSDMTELAETVATALLQGEKVALGFECPLFVPLCNRPEDLTKVRSGETSPNWIGGVGSTVLATGLPQVSWILRQIKQRLGQSCIAYLSWEEFNTTPAGLFLWEAFVSGKAKGNNHIDDARRAVDAFRIGLPDPRLSDVFSDESVISLIGMALLRTGWSRDVQLLSQRCLVVKPVVA